MEWIGDVERAFASAIYPNRVLFAAAGIGILVVVALVARRRRWDLAARRRPRLATGLTVLGLLVALPVAWYLGSPLFISNTVDEPAPVVMAAVPSVEPATGGPAAASPAAPTAAATPAPTLVDRTGTFHGADEFHFGRGTARLIETSPGTFTVRLEDFAVRNGPDLFVYLSPAADGYARGSIELGRLKADRGNQNYALAAGSDVSRARSVVIWCKQFSVLFATSPLS
jgi:electron transfer DM13